MVGEIISECWATSSGIRTTVDEIADEDHFPF